MVYEVWQECPWTMMFAGDILICRESKGEPWGGGSLRWREGEWQSVGARQRI